MKPIEQDLPSRQPVWEALQMLFMDTSQSHELPRIAQACAQSPYTVDELRSILFSGVFPACRSNMNPLTWPGGEWAGFDRDWLTERILRKHRHGKRPLLMGWLRTAYWWARLKPKILALPGGWTMPLIAAISTDGIVLGQWQGLTDVSSVRRVVF